MVKNKNLLIKGLIFIVGLELVFLHLSRRKEEVFKNQILRLTEQVAIERQSLQTGIKEARQLIEALQGSLEEKKKELLDTQNKNTELEEKLANAGQRTEELVKELEKTTTIKQDTQNKLEVALKKLEAYNLVKLKRLLSEKNKELSKLGNKFRKLEVAHFSLIEKMRKFDPEKIKLQNELEEARNQQQDIITRLSEVLAKKELELNSITKERDALKEEFAVLRLDHDDLEKQLSSAQIDQAKTAKLLTELTQLNERLAGNLSQYSQFQEERVKAKELKRRVEIMLTPKEKP